MRKIVWSVALATALAVAGCGDETAGGSSASDSPAASPSAPPSASAPASATGPVAALTFPAEGATVHQCEIFTGTASFTDDTRTLVLGMRNLDNRDPNRYFETVNDWEYPKDLGQWTGAQYFGSGDSAVGQRFRAELLIVPMAVAQKAEESKKGWYGPKNPDGSEIVAHVTVKRIAGDGPPECAE